VVRMKSSSSREEAATATCTVPFFSPRDYTRHIREFDEIIDVRSPGEFEEDHIPGAVNLPVLDNAERAEVGTLHNTRGEKHLARQLGAAYISANTSRFLKQHFYGKDLTYRPLVYCWRGGQRSRSLAIILKEIGFCPSVLQGGWKEYRKLVRDGVTLVQDPARDLQLDRLDRCRLLLVSGTTGSGKSLLLETLEARGEQVVHLERLAKHKGSTLGNYWGEPQPTQKMFETLLWHQILRLDPSKVIWVENESAKIGKIAVPNRFWKKMCRSPRVHLQTCLEDRVLFTMSDYSYFCNDRGLPTLVELISRLEKHAGKQKPKEWIQLARESKWQELTRELIVEYYDRNYKSPRGSPLATFALPPGLILAPADLSTSAVLEEIVTFGEQFVSSQPEEKEEEEVLKEQEKLREEEELLAKEKQEREEEEKLRETEELTKVESETLHSHVKDLNCNQVEA